MISYDEFTTFRTPAKRSPARRSPERVQALDDLHRTLYGSLHPSAIIETDGELVEGEEGSGESWLEQNALTAAITVVGAFALIAWLKRPKEPPLHGPADPAPEARGPRPE